MLRRIFILIVLALIAIGVFFSNVTPAHADDYWGYSQIICRTCD